LGQTATLTAVDLNLSWTKQFNRWATFSVGVGVFNVFNTRVITGSDDNIELQSGVTDPDYLTPNAFQTPRLVRVFAKWSF
jgi:outer membrane receptor protein involved in Fe transport